MRKYHDNHDYYRDRMHGESNSLDVFLTATHDWIKIILLMLIFPAWLNQHRHVNVMAADEVSSILGDAWALNCQPDSDHHQAAVEFCNDLGGKEASTMCMCHDEGELWPLCKQQQQQQQQSGASNLISSYGICDLETYTGCLIACSNYIETVLCQDTELLQCTVVASNLRSHVS